MTTPSVHTHSHNGQGWGPAGGCFVACGLALMWLCATLASAQQPAVATGASTTSGTRSQAGQTVHLASQDANEPSTLAPPLSLYESSLQLKSALQVLGRPSEKLTEPEQEWVEQVLRVVGLYVEQVDLNHSSLPYYRWQRITSKKIRHQTWAERVVTLSEPIKGVTALGLRSYHADLEIQRIVATGLDKRKWIFNRSMLVPADQPRDEICFLPLPTDLVEISVVCRVAEDEEEKPRLNISAGISAIAESGKEACYTLQLARDHLKRGERTECAAQIKRCLELLEQFRKSRRL